MLLRQRLGSRPEPEVLPAIELVVMVPHQLVRRLEVRPRHQEHERQAPIRMREGVRGRLLLRLDVVEIGQATEVGPQVLGAEEALERRPAQILRLRLAAERIQRRDAQVDLPLFLMAAGSTIQPGQRFGRTVVSNQPLGDVAREVLRSAAGLDGSDVGVDISLEIGQLPQAQRHHKAAARLEVVSSAPARQAGEAGLQQTAQLCPPIGPQRRT